MNELYDGILCRNRSRLLAGGVGDPFLTSAVTDERMSLALVFRPAREIAERILAHVGPLQKAEPALYYYPLQDLHVTVIEILKGIPGRTIPDDLERYIRCVEACARRTPAFDVVFDGMTASDNVVMVRGFYEDGLDGFRAALRRELSRRSLLLEERYQTISAHISVARVPCRLQDPEALLAYLSEPAFFGAMRVDSLELVFHNWYDSQKTVLARVPLGG